MRASEWQYLCAVHDPPKSCCAIDYCCHTLDWAANILTSQKHFPSRLTLGGDTGGGSQASVRQLTNIFRRVYRMFAHAWFQHKDVFWTLENHEGIYIFYKTVCDIYQLIPEENYTIPAEAEGLASEEEQESRRSYGPPEYRMHQKPNGTAERSSVIDQAADSSAQTTISTGATTRRHKHTPSTGSFVTTIQEEHDEESEDGKADEAPPDTASMIHNMRSESSNRQPDVSVPEINPPLKAESTEAMNEQPIEANPKLEKEEDAQSIAEKPDPASIESSGVTQPSDAGPEQSKEQASSESPT